MKKNKEKKCAICDESIKIIIDALKKSIHAYKEFNEAMMLLDKIKDEIGGMDEETL